MISTLYKFMILATVKWLVFGLAAANGADPISIVIKRVAVPPVIDGNIEDRCWQNAQWMPLRNLQGDAVKVGGRVAMVFDDEKLYAAFSLDEPELEKMKDPAVDVNAKEIWNGEMLEWFINPVPEGSAYLHLGWNPAGSQYNVKCYKGKTIPPFMMDSCVRWMPKWIVATTRCKSGWRSEAAISFAELGQKPPNEGDVWRINLCRTRNIGEVENSCLSPSPGGFHHPRNFAEVWFNKEDRLAGASAAVVSLHPDDMKYDLLRTFGMTLTVGPNLACGGDAESAATAWGSQVKVTPEAKHGGNAGYELEVINGRATSDDLIPIVPGKTYRLSGYFRSPDLQKPASAYFGLNLYDAQKRMITFANVSVNQGTETALSRPANIGDTVVAIQNGESWESGCLAFNIQDEYRDLPNCDTSSQIANITKRHELYEVQLKNPLAKFYPAGTRVRNHAFWGSSLYWVADSWIGGEWEEHGTYIGGEAKSGTPMNQFWAGAKFMQVFVQLGNYNRVPIKGAKLWFDDICLEEISVKH